MSSIGWYKSTGPSIGGHEATTLIGPVGEQDLEVERALLSSGVDVSGSVLVLADCSLEEGEDPLFFVKDDV